MKIIQLLPALDGGGVEQGTLEMGRFLAAQGHQSVVVSSGGRLQERLVREGTRHITLPIGRKSVSSLRLIGALRRLIVHEQPDIVHVRSRLPAWLTYLAWKRLPAKRRPRLVSTVHGFYGVHRYSRIMTVGERVIAVSKSVAQYVLENYPHLSPSRLRVVPRGVDPAEYPRGYQPEAAWLRSWQAQYPQLRNRFVVCLPGRLSRRKGQRDCLDVVHRLRGRGIPAQALMVGEAHRNKPHYLDELKRRAAELSLDDAVTFTGHRTDLRNILAVSDVVVSCSIDPEAFGRVTLEALALGRPTAAYDHGGVSEQLTAIFPEGKIAVGDTAAMADRLSQWYAAPPIPHRENPFTLQAMQRQTLSVYEELCSARPRTDSRHRADGRRGDLSRTE